MAARATAGFTAPAFAEPTAGALATRAFFVVLRELINDFFGMVTVSSSSDWFYFLSSNTGVMSTSHAKLIAFCRHAVKHNNLLGFDPFD